MKLGALIPLDKSSSICQKLYFYLVRVVSLSLPVWNVVVCTFYYVFIERTVEQLLRFTNSVIYVGVIIRMMLYYSKDAKTLEIINTANAKFKLTARTQVEEFDIQMLVDIANLVMLVQTFCSFVAANIFYIIPILQGKKVMELWYPYNSTISPYYELSYIHQFICQYVICYYYNILDAFYICVVVAIAGQFKILAWEMENICFSSLVACGFDRSLILEFKTYLPTSKPIEKGDFFFELYEFMQTEQYLNILRYKMVEVIRYHKDILKLCDFLEDFFSTALLLIFLNILSNSVLILYGLSLTTTLIDRLQMISYFLASALECFVVAYTSDFLLHESSKVQFSLYSAPWYLCPKKISSVFKFCHFRLRLNVGISLGKFRTFDLEAYSWVVKTSFSYFTVLSKK